MLLTKRVQVLFPEDLWQGLLSRSHQQNRSVGELIREAVVRVYFGEERDNEQTKRMQIVKDLAALELPVADWEQMEQESTR